MDHPEQPAPEKESEKESELRAFGAVLRRVRKERGMSQEELGWKTHTDQRFISDLERGIKEPGFRTILKLLRGLGMPLHEFMKEVEKALHEKKIRFPDKTSP